MARAILAWFLSITIALPSWGLTTEQTKNVNDFLKTTDLATRSVTWKELYQKIEKDLPLDVRREMTLFLKQYPNARLPQAKVTKIHEGASEVVQLEFRTGKDQAFLRIEGKSDFATLKGVQGGKKFDLRLSRFELNNPVRWISSISGVKPWTEKVPTVQVLTADEVKLLKPQEKQKYIDRIREVMEAAEKVQNSLQRKHRSADNRDFFWNLMNATANAQTPAAPAGGGSSPSGPTGDCIVAGYVGQYQEGSCQPPAQARSGNCTSCNPEVYGSQVTCAGPKTGKLPLNATEICNQNTESKKYALFQGVQNDQQVQERRNQLSAALTSLSEKCTGIEAGVTAGTKLSDQAQTCGALRTRIQELQAVQCQVLAQQAAQFPNLRCQGGQDAQMPAPPPVTGNPAAPPGQVTAQDPVPPNAQAGGDCLNLPTGRDVLHCNDSQKKTKTCERGGEQFTAYYCECAAGEVGDKPNTLLDVGCSPSRAASSESGRTSSERSGRREREESWFKPWMGVALAGGAGLLLWYYASRQSLKDRYGAYNATTSTVTPVPPPVTTVTSPGLLSAPAPVDNVNRNSPGTR